MRGVEVNRDVARLRELGYEQELSRRLGIVDNVAMGFATISPVVGLYAVAFVGLTVAGPAWIWVLPIALAGQCLLLAVYSELASEFPIANGAYQWSRRLVGPRYAWFNGWVALCAFGVANATIAYLGAPWALAVLGIDASASAIVITGAVLVIACSLVNALGIDRMRKVIRVGVAAEVTALAGIAATLLLAFGDHGISLFGETLGAEALSGGSVVAAMLAALAVGGWVFIGFDACVGTAEETYGADFFVPRALWIAMLSVAVLVIVNAVSIALAHPDPAAVVAGRDTDPVTTAVVEAFGSWSSRPFAAVVLVAFVACGIAAQGLTARGLYSVARDGVLPASSFLRRVDARRVPVGALITTTAIACAGLLLALDAAAIGSMITFGTAAIYVSFLLTAIAALVGRLRGTWVPAGRVRLGRAAIPINVAAVCWLAFETVNIAWPRESLAPVGAPAYQVWAAPLVLAVIAVVGLAYLAWAKPHRRLTGSAPR